MAEKQNLCQLEVLEMSTIVGKFLQPYFWMNYEVDYSFFAQNRNLKPMCTAVVCKQSFAY